MRMHKPAPATVIAIVALVVALSGTAIAANRYVITSRSQIKPAVLSSLSAPRQASLERILTSPVSVAPGKQVGLIEADCLKGEHVISGGYDVELAPGAYVTTSTGIFNGWLLQLDTSRASEASTVQVSALCSSGDVPIRGVTVKAVTH